MSNIFSVGVDLGQKTDYSVFSIAHYNPVPNTCVIREIAQLPLGTTYPVIVRSLRLICSELAQKGEVVSLWYDGTGNLAFSDYISEEFDKYHLDTPLYPLIFTGGAKGSKKQLISNMKTLHSRSILMFEKNSDEQERTIKALIEEMKNYEDKRIGTDEEELGVFKTGRHDDMVTACALSVKDYPQYMDANARAFIGIADNSNWVKTPLDESTGEDDSSPLLVEPSYEGYEL